MVNEVEAAEEGLLAAEFRRRLEAIALEETQLERRRAWSGNLRFVAACLMPPLIIAMAWYRAPGAGWLLVPLAAFLALSIVFARATHALHTRRHARAYFELLLARLEDRWHGLGVPGTEFLDPAHPFAADLDLFGRGSLFERLCLARTRIGRATLARWLLEPAEPAEIAARQQAVRELRDLPDWRERLALAAEDLPGGVDVSTLESWCRLTPTQPRPIIRRLALLCPIVSTAAIALWAFDAGPAWAPLGALLAQGIFALALQPRIHAALQGLRGRSRDLFQLAGILAAIESAPFHAPRLRQLQQALQAGGLPPSQRLHELAVLIGRIDATRDQLFGLIAPLVLWTTRAALAAEDWRRGVGTGLGRWLEILGEAEALASLAEYARENPRDVFPTVGDGAARFEVQALAHPLLPRARAVVNDVALNEESRLWLVSGSNMAGKSTLLRAVGVAAVLAQAGAPVRAAQARLSPLALGATLRIQDSLLSGKSRFYAEITRLREIMNLTERPRPVLYLLDELLSGTNSHDRRLGAAAILRSLVRRAAIGLVTTHDLALTHLADEFAPHARNVHFEDDFRHGELHFDYRLRPGVVRHSNALALMRAVGLEVDAASELPPA